MTSLQDLRREFRRTIARVANAGDVDVLAGHLAEGDPHTQYMLESLTFLNMTLGPFYINDATTSAALQATLGYFNTATAVSRATNDIRMDLAGRIVGIILVSDDARTAGTATARARVNGSTQVFNSGAVVLDGTNTTSDSSFVSFANGVAFTAGQTIGVEVLTGSWAPTTANFTLWLIVAMDPF